MSLRGEFCRVLDKYKSGTWDRDKSAAALEKYFDAHITALIQEARVEELKKVINEYNFLQEEVEQPTKELKIGNKYVLKRLEQLSGGSNNE